MPKLRLIQALTTGTDHIQALPNLGKHVTLAAARGFHGPQMSELAFIFLLHFTRDFRDLFATQAAHRWNRVEQVIVSFTDPRNPACRLTGRLLFSDLVPDSAALRAAA